MYKICSRRECSQLIKTESCRIWLLSWLSWDAWSLQDRAAGGKDQCLGLRSSLGAWFCSSPHTPGIPWPPLDIVANPASLPCRTVEEMSMINWHNWRYHDAKNWIEKSLIPIWTHWGYNNDSSIPVVFRNNKLITFDS